MREIQFRTERDDAVVSISKRQATLKSKILLDTFDYWNGLRRGDALPSRGDIDPRRIEGALPYAFILELTTPTLARFRVAGGHLNDLMGMEVRGMPLAGLFEPTDRARLQCVVENLFDGPKWAELSLRGEGKGQQGLSADVLILPVLDDRGAVTRALGCFVSRGIPGEEPNRFCISSVRTTSLPKQKAIDTSVVRTPRRSHELTGMAEEFAPFLPKGMGEKVAEQPSRRPAPHLRVVK